MKQALLKFTGRKFVSAAFLAASLALTSVAATANVGKNYIEIVSGESTNIQFTGSTSDALLFKVHVKNEKADNFTLTIRNSGGDVLFAKTFNEVDFEKQFKLIKGDQDNLQYTFTITSANKNIEGTYVITTTERTVNDVAINKL
jgi:hypothetical protein